MHLLFVDESGTPPRPDALAKGARYFVVGGAIIAEAAWPRVRDRFSGIKSRHGIRGEIKWQYFSPHNQDAHNPLRHLDPAGRDIVRAEIYAMLCAGNAVTTLACVASAPAAYGYDPIATQADLYHATYKPVIERFQYFLQGVGRGLGRREYGIVVSDHRGPADDRNLRQHHDTLIYSTGRNVVRYANLVESVFLQPSHLSVGIQLADMVAGAVWRRFERNDDRWYSKLEPSLRTDAKGGVAGYGIVRFPKEGWDWTPGEAGASTC